MLAAYDLLDEDVGYTQGMNYLAGLILIGVDYDEVMAFAIMDKLMREPGNFGRLYKKNLELLFTLTDHIYGWMLQE